MFACKFLEAERQAEIYPIKWACSSHFSNRSWVSLNSSFFLSSMSFSTAEVIFSASSKDYSALLLTCSRSICWFFSESSLCLIELLIFLAASNHCILFSSSLFRTATEILFLASSEAKSESWFLRMATSPSSSSFCFSSLFKFSLLYWIVRSSLWFSVSFQALSSLALSKIFWLSLCSYSFSFRLYFAS